MLIFFSIFIIQGIKIQNGHKMKHFLVCYIGRYDILSKQIRQIRAYHRKLIVISIYKDVNLHSKNKTFLSYKVANNNYLGDSFQVLIFDSKLDILPKTYQGGTSCIKISIKITYYLLL